MREAKFLKVGIALCCFSLAGIVLTTCTRLGECGSDSLIGVKYVLFLKSTTFNRGDIVLIQKHIPHHETHIHKNPQKKGEISFAKRILGAPGDILIRGQEKICVIPLQEKDEPSKLTQISFSKGVPLLTKEFLEKKFLEVKSLIKSREVKPLPLLARTKDGKPLIPLKADRVPEGYVFVAGDHPRSFDSRYEEFGLVPFEKVWGKAILTW